MSDFDLVRNKVDIVSHISKYVKLERRGSDLVGLCPFHSEKTPSFHVNEREQYFYCFGCKVGGDVITFHSLIKGYDNLDSLKDLAREYGIELSKGYSKETTAKKKKIEEMQKLNEEAREFFVSEYEKVYDEIVVQNLPEEKTNKKKENIFLDYINGRKINEKTRKLFQLGIDNNNNLTTYLLKKHEDVSKYEEVGLIIKAQKSGKYFDRFNERIVFPIINYRGETVGFSARLVKERKDVGKYINSKDTDIFHKRENLFGLNLTRDAIIKEEMVIIVEGQIDVITLFQAGIKNVTASLGTAFTQEGVDLIKKWTKTAVLCYDNDSAGVKALLTAGDMLEDNDFKVKVISFSQSGVLETEEMPKDPDEYINNFGTESFKKEIERAISFLDFKINLIREDCEKKKSEKTEYIKKVLELLTQCKTRVVIGEKIKELSEETGAREDDIRSDFERIINSPSFKVKQENEKQYSREKNDFQKIEDKSIKSKEEEKLINEIFTIMTLKDFSLAKQIKEEEIIALNEKQKAYLNMLKNVANESELSTEKKKVEKLLREGKVNIFKDYKKQFNEIVLKLKKIKLEVERTKIYQELKTIDEAVDISDEEKEKHRKDGLERINKLTKAINSLGKGEK